MLNCLQIFKDFNEKGIFYIVVGGIELIHS